MKSENRNRRDGSVAFGFEAAGSGAQVASSWWERQEKRFQASSDVMNQIRRQYRERFGRQADWKGYVAGLVGVSAYTVGAWRVGVQRPTVERARMLRGICEELGEKAEMLKR
jgi:hypothetical protein